MPSYYMVAQPNEAPVKKAKKVKPPTAGGAVVAGTVGAVTIGGGPLVEGLRMKNAYKAGADEFLSRLENIRNTWNRDAKRIFRDYRPRRGQAGAVEMRKNAAKTVSGIRLERDRLINSAIARRARDLAASKQMLKAGGILTAVGAVVGIGVYFLHKHIKQKRAEKTAAIA